MLKFFRKIRQNLLVEGRVGKYILYAIGEVALVMIGILLALQVNNWNEERIQTYKLKVYLENLKNDLNSDIIAMNRLRDCNMFRFYSMQYLLMLSGEEVLDLNLDETTVPLWTGENFVWSDSIPTVYHNDFIQLAFLWSHRAARKDITKTTINELNSTGSFSYINNTELKEKINDYYTFCDFRILESISGYTSTIQDWQRSLVEDGVVNFDPFIVEDPIDLLRTNTKRTGILRRLIRGAGWLAEGGPIIAKEAQLLIDRIDKEIGDD